MEYELIVWDLETSGFEAPRDKILEIGCFLFEKEGDKPVEKQWILQNNIAIDAEITRITGITNELIDKEGKDPKEGVKEFVGLLKRAKRHVTHNGISFDIPFLVNTTADMFGFSSEEKTKMLDLLRKTAFDTAVHFKAKKMGVGIGPAEPFEFFADRIIAMRAPGVKYNLGICCDECEIDRSNVRQHRALADVYLTHKLYDLITLPQLFETPYKEE